MKINIPQQIYEEISKLVSSGEFSSEQEAVEKIIQKSLNRRTNKTENRFGYQAPKLTSQELENEDWRPIPFTGFSKYEVSNLGNIRSLKFGVKPIKLSLHTTGYRQAPIYNDEGKQKHFLVHRLVASAFIPAPSGKPDVNHRNGNKADNRAANLEWMSAEENCQHSVKAGLRHWRGSHHRAKVTDTDVKTIRAATPEQIPQLAKKYELSVVQIRNIRTKKSWAHIE